MTDKPTPKEIYDLVYELRQAGKDDTYSLASAVLAKWGQPAQAAEPVALLVRKNSWRDGQWEVAPPNSPSYGLAWADQRMYVYATPQPTQPQAGVVPLTPDRIAEIADAAHLEYDRHVSLGQCVPRWSAVFAHLLEMHHGIKGGPRGTE